ncbi:MAG TPA: MgtC/SapB family protein [Anaerolineae bacterium]|nr:MgtC/SapB family protein [Anaerolineae bacterium]
MDIFWEELVFGLPDTRALIRIIVRLLASTLLGAVIGYQRESVGKPAGLRTHILVSLGTTAFVLACFEAGMSSDGLSRVIQGIVTGIGFIGAGSILKLSEERDIQGLTTAAGIWMTAAVGVAVGLGMLGVALLSTFLTLVTLALMGSWEYRIEKGQRAKNEERNKKAGQE